MRITWIRGIASADLSFLALATFSLFPFPLRFLLDLLGHGSVGKEKIELRPKYLLGTVVFTAGSNH